MARKLRLLTALLLPLELTTKNLPPNEKWLFSSQTGSDYDPSIYVIKQADTVRKSPSHNENIISTTNAARLFTDRRLSDVECRNRCKGQWTLDGNPLNRCPSPDSRTVGKCFNIFKYTGHSMVATG